MEAHVVYPTWSTGVKIDCVKYEFLGGEDEGAGGERDALSPGSLFVGGRGEESNLVDDGVNDLGGYA